MVRYDLAFFLCCCKSFLGDDPSTEDFYQLLALDRDASPDEIKKAYKRQSLQMHPDKLAQKGKIVTVEDQSRFTRMKEAYEVSVARNQTNTKYHSNAHTPEHSVRAKNLLVHTSSMLNHAFRTLTHSLARIDSFHHRCYQTLTSEKHTMPSVNEA
jgi:hypothetical protein